MQSPPASSHNAASNQTFSTALPFYTHGQKYRMQTQQLCLLFQLPPEIRNCIYEMTFECDLTFIDIATAFAQPGENEPFDPESGVWTRMSDRIYGPNYFDLDAAAPPSTALLRSCQRIHLESKGLFITASKAYWEMEFVINLRDNHSDAPYILNTPDQYLARIRKLTFLVRHSGFPVKASWNWSPNSWNVQTFDQSPNQDAFDTIDHENADAAVLGVKAMMLNPTSIPDGVSQYQPYNLPFLQRCDIEAMLHHLRNEQRAFELMCLAASIGHADTGRLVDYYLDISVR